MGDKPEDKTTDDGDTGNKPDGADGGDGKDLAAEVEKWKTMSRRHEQRAKENAAAAQRLKELEDADKSETERLMEASKAAEKRAEEAEAKALRYEVAADKNVPAKLARFLTGSTREELEAAADELIEATGGNGKEPGTGESSGETGGGKPKEKLRGGASSEDDSEEKPVSDVLAAIPRG
jgi:hypothetical protein